MLLRGCQGSLRALKGGDSTLIETEPLTSEGEGRFTLTEMNGAQTRVVRIETIKSERCGE